MGITTTKIGDSISVLLITSVTAGNSGNYTCTARNEAGVTNHTATLLVNGTTISCVIVIIILTNIAMVVFLVTT